jgi:hypothetical protein
MDVARSGNKGWSLYGAPWSQPVATGRKIASPRKPRNQAETVAVGCDRLPRAAHGKEGVSGSSPDGSSTPDAIGSILVGVLLASVATVLIDRNREFLIGEESPRVRAAALRALLAEAEVARVTYLRLEFVGPRLVSIIGDVDLTGDDAESNVSVRLRALEAKMDASPAVAGTVLSLSAPDEPSLTE